MNSKTFLGASVAAAVVASFCCILPIVFAVAGISIVGAAGLFAAWRPYLLVVTFALLGLGFYFAYRPAQQACEPGAVCARPGTSRAGRIALWVVTVAVLAFASFPYYSGPVAELILSSRQEKAASARPAPKIERVLLAVEGMDCTACASAVEKKLKSLAGVHKASVSYETGRAQVEYDGAVVGLEQIENAVRDAGYRARKLS